MSYLFQPFSLGEFCCLLGVLPSVAQPPARLSVLLKLALGATGAAPVQQSNYSFAPPYIVAQLI